MFYQRLVSNLEDPKEESKDYDVYPFEYGYEFFTAGLAVGYIEGEQYDGEYEGDGEYYNLFRLGQLDQNNPEHVSCIKLFEHLINLESMAEASDDDSEDEGHQEVEVGWDEIVAYADKGVGILHGDWKENHELDVEQYFEDIGFEAEDRLEDFEDELTTRPTAGDKGNLTL
jgi:hypothetical protein